MKIKMNREFFLCFLCPPLSLPAAIKGIRSSLKSWRAYVFLLALFLATVAYCYTPVVDEPDIIRYFEWAEILGKMPFGEAVTYVFKGERHLYVLNAFLWFGGKLGDLHLIPALSIFIIYYICFYITCFVAEKEGTPSKYVCWYIVFATATLNFYGLTNNVRNVLGFCIIGYAFFREIYKEKRDLWTIVLYTIPLFLHSSCFVIILIRLILLIPGTYKIPFAGAATLVVPITGFLYSHINWFSSGNIISQVIKMAIAKAYIYYRNDAAEWAVAVANSGSHKLSRIVYIILSVLMCLAIYFYQLHGKQKKKRAKNTTMGEFVFYVGIITIACAPMPMPEYWRFVSLLIVMGGTVIPPLYMRRCKASGVFALTTFICSPICLALWVRNIMQCEILNLIFKPFVMNPIIIFLKDLLNVIYL